MHGDTRLVAVLQTVIENFQSKLTNEQIAASLVEVMTPYAGAPKLTGPLALSDEEAALLKLHCAQLNDPHSFPVGIKIQLIKSMCDRYGPNLSSLKGAKEFVEAHIADEVLNGTSFEDKQAKKEGPKGKKVEGVWVPDESELTEENFKKTLEDFFEKLVAKCDAQHKSSYPNLKPDLMSYKDGKRYVKIIRGTSVWGFVDKTNGDILKAASWKAPAKHARGNIFSPDPLDGMSWTGPYYLK